MANRLPITLAVIGLVIILLSLAALAYAFWPVASLQEQAPLAPTLFMHP